MLAQWGSVEIEAREVYQQLVAVTPGGSPEGSGYLDVLEKVIRESIRTGGDLTQLARALAAWKGGVRKLLTPSGK